MNKRPPAHYANVPKLEGKPVTVCAFDTETSGLGGQLLYATLATPDDEHAFSGDPDTIARRLIDQMFMRPSGRATFYKFRAVYKLEQFAPVYFAHNMQYDARYLVFAAHALGLRLEFSMRTDSDFYQIKIINPQTYQFICLRDSAAIFPARLDKFAAQFAEPGLQKLEGPDFENGEIFDPSNPKHCDYAMRDSVALRSALNGYFAAVHRLYGVHSGPTAAGTALRAWQKTMPQGERIYNLSAPSEEFFRAGYYGGLVFLTSTARFENCPTFDINSSYPASMRKIGAPIGKPAFTQRYFKFSERPGMYDVTVTAPAGLVIPILPTRVNGVIRWPAGTFRTIVTNLEIDFATAHGYTVDTLHSGMVYEGMTPIFTQFVDASEKIRAENKETAFETVAKQMQNSVYGKFASARERRQVVDFDAALSGAIPLDNFPSPQTGDPMYCVVRTASIRDESITRPDFAAFITAASRIALLTAAYAVGPENVLYGDTDSLTLKPGVDYSAIDVGPRYGQFKLEKTWETFRAIAPKVYAGVREIKGKPTSTGAAKGLSKKKMTAEKFAELFVNGACTLRYDTLDKLMKVMRTGKIEAAREVQRVLVGVQSSSNYAKVEGSEDVRPRAL